MNEEQLVKIIKMQNEQLENVKECLVALDDLINGVTKDFDYNLTIPSEMFFSICEQIKRCVGLGLKFCNMGGSNE